MAYLDPLELVKATRELAEATKALFRESRQVEQYEFALTTAKNTILNSDAAAKENGGPVVCNGSNETIRKAQLDIAVSDEAAELRAAKAAHEEAKLRFDLAQQRVKTLDMALRNVGR